MFRNIRENKIVDLNNQIRRNIEAVVKKNGCLMIATHNDDYDEEENFIGDYSKEFEIAEKYVKIYNPDGLDPTKYKRAYSRGELNWQKRIIRKQ